MFEFKGSTALITGATGGLGEAFGQELAERGSHLVLVARSEDKLNTLQERLQEKYRINVRVLQADLASATAVEELTTQLKAQHVEVDLLINNAGFGVFQKFLTTSIERQLEEIDVNVRALVSLTYALAPAMVTRRKGGVINISSAAGFQPVVGASVYAASKSFVLFFSEALAQELSGTGVWVLAVCPGPMATGFFADKKPDLKRNQMDDPTGVVAEALRAFDRGKRVLVPGRLSVRLTALAPRFLPRNLIVQISERVSRRLNHV